MRHLVALSLPVIFRSRLSIPDFPVTLQTPQCLRSSLSSLLTPSPHLLLTLSPHPLPFVVALLLDLSSCLRILTSSHTSVSLPPLPLLFSVAFSLPPSRPQPPTSSSCCCCPCSPLPCCYSFFSSPMNVEWIRHGYKMEKEIKSWYV